MANIGKNSFVISNPLNKYIFKYIIVKIYKLLLILSVFTLLYIIFVDSAFTERILGLPVENYKGYVEADATQRARHIPSYSFYLMHGLADITAPYLHGTQMARALTEAGVIFQYQVSIHHLDLILL